MHRRWRTSPPRPSSSSSRGGRTSISLLRTLNARSATGSSRGVELWAEDESVLRQQLEHLDLSPAATAVYGTGPTKSTIAVAFSTDGELFASTHGDHTVKITCFLRGKVVQTLRGHPRTPWTVKFHPKDSKIVASGCLGFEVRVWNTSTGRCLHKVTLEAAIISLSFHPSGRMLAMASSLYVYLWDYNNKARPFIAWAHSHTLRCVRFTPGGNGIIVGAANGSSVIPSSQAQNQGTAPAGGGAGAASEAAATAPPAAPPPPPPPQPAEVTFRLQVWDFSLEAALSGVIVSAMTRERVLLAQTLLYNDGGFDVSQDGLWLCAIAGMREKAVPDLCPPLNTNRGWDCVPNLPLSTTAAAAAAAATASAMATVMEKKVVVGDAAGAASAAVEAPRDLKRCARGSADDDDDGRSGPGVADGREGNSTINSRSDGCGGSSSSSSSNGNVAPKSGSQRGSPWDQQTPTATRVIGTAAPAGIASAVKEGSIGAIAGGGGGGGVVREGVSGTDNRGERQLGVEAVTPEAREASAQGEPGERGGGGRRRPMLLAWPSRARQKGGLGGAIAGENVGGRAGVGAGRGREGRTSVAEGSPAAATVAVVRSDGAKNATPTFTPPPLTPSPRITLKRPLSSSSSGAAGGGRGSGGSGGGGGFWSRELRRGGSPRIAGSAERGEGRCDGGAIPQGGGHRPPVLPPRPPPSGVSVGGLLPSSPLPPSTSPLPSSAADARRLPPPPPPSPSLPLAAAADVAPSSSPPSSLPTEGGLQVSLPLLLPPPPPQPSSRRDVDSGNTIGPSAPSGDFGVGGDSQQQQQQQQQQQESEPLLPPPQSSQPLFFLQVPAAGPAAAGVDVTERGEVGEGERGQGGGWDTQYLDAAGTARGEDNLPSTEPVTYGRGRAGGGGGGAGGRLGRNGITEGQSDASGGQESRQEGSLGVPVVRRRRAGWGGNPQEGDSTSWGSTGSSSISSFGRAQCRVSTLPPSSSLTAASPPGKLVPHLVLVSLNLDGRKSGGGGEGGEEKAARVVRAEAMDSLTAKQVTSVKLSPSSRYILLGVGVRGGGGGGTAGGSTGTATQAPQQAVIPDGRGDAASAAVPHTREPAISSIYRSADLQPVNSMPTAEEDVNIACFHPDPGMGCVYGTKQGRVGLVRMAD